MQCLEKIGSRSARCLCLGQSWHHFYFYFAAKQSHTSRTRQTAAPVMLLVNLSIFVELHTRNSYATSQKYLLTYQGFTLVCFYFSNWVVQRQVCWCAEHDTRIEKCKIWMLYGNLRKNTFVNTVAKIFFKKVHGEIMSNPGIQKISHTDVANVITVQLLLQH